MEKIVFVLASVALCFASAILLPNQSNRISGDTNLATAKQFPYAVSVQQISNLPNQTNAHRCGGALITPQHVLTSAQCTYNTFANGTVVNILPSQYRVFAGDNLLSNGNITESIRNIANFTVHPAHQRAPALLNDIAIITLVSPYLNSTATPIPLPTAGFVPQDFTVCTLTGWGAQALGQNASNALRYANKYLYNHTACTNLYGSQVSLLNIHPSMICATSYDTLSVGCTGDEGNALVCDGQLSGILSLTNKCVVSAYPEVYTRVSNYTTWIRSVTGGTSSFKPELGLLALAAIVYAALFS